MSIEAVIFDLDGVLVSTSELHYEAWKSLSQKYGISFDRDFNERFKGVSRSDCVRMLFPSEKDTKLLDAMSDEKNAYYCELISSLTPQDVFPGVRELISNLKNNNIKTAVGSVSKNTSVVLEQLGISDVFDVVVDGNDIKNSKPRPDVFLFAAGRLNVHPENCVVVEDAAAGIRAAHLAGMLTVGVGPNDTLFEAGQLVSCVGELTFEYFDNLY
ncbi:MAG: beta-phosphoglucomutase [Sedimentisphaeraceae bacterium JB056]